jgi:uncharacterized protein YcbX
MARVTDLFVHPLKGALPQRVHRLVLDPLGALGDRRWVLVDEAAAQITAREAPRLATMRATLPLHDGAVATESPLALSVDGLPPLVVPLAGPEAPRRAVRIWDDTVELADTGDAAAEWCSEAIDRSCRLMHLVPESRRALAGKYAGPLPADDRTVALSDGAPLLLLGAASLDALNSRLTAAGARPLGIERFRPNVVLATHVAHEEDTWSRIRIGDLEVGVGSPCPRCVVTTLDPHTLAYGTEPLRTLAAYRRGAGGGLMFGMNATHATPGEFAVGDAVSVLSLRPAPAPSD